MQIANDEMVLPSCFMRFGVSTHSISVLTTFVSANTFISNITDPFKDKNEGSSRVLQPKFPSCSLNPTPASSLLSPGQFISFRPRQIFVCDSTSSIARTNTPQESFQTLRSVTSLGAVFAASFSATSTSTVIEILTTSAPTSFQGVASSTAVPKIPSNRSDRNSDPFSRLSIDAKAGLLLGLILFFIILSVLSLHVYTRKRRLAGYLMPTSHHPTSYTQETQHPTSATPEPPRVRVVVIPAGLPRTIMDGRGIRWPEPVVLQGEAKEVSEWTEEYGRLRRVVGAEHPLERYEF